MSKLTGAYTSIVRGVSEQVPQDRLEGQHWEQVNLISDPIRGLCRRRGSEYCAQKLIFGTEPDDYTKSDLARYKEQSFHYRNDEYSLLYRGKARTGWSLGDNELMVYNKTQKTFLASVQTDAAKAVLDGGISSVCLVGQFLLMASRTQTPTYSDVDKVAQTNIYHTVWIKAGEYSRTYSVTCTFNGTTKTSSYTTMKSYYDGVLDTSNIPVLDSKGEVRKEYQKEVNDAVNAYNGRVNQHLAAATADRQPQNIAENVKGAILRDWNWAFAVDRDGSHLQITYPSSVVSDDGGDGNAMITTSNSVSTLSHLTRRHHVGKTVKVSITDSDPYYVRADSTVPGLTGYQEVIWREGAGREHTPTFLCLMGVIRNGTLWVGKDPADLQKLLDDRVHDGTAVPTYQPSTAGDDNTCPVPAIFTKPIDYITMFQQRLLFVAGATVVTSRTEDYFNLFRKSALKLDADDPVEMTSAGNEDDHIRSALMLDRNLIMFGDLQQYFLNGRDVLTYNNAALAPMSAFEGSASAMPAGLGGQLFFTQYRGGRTQLMQMQTGNFSDTFDTYSVSQQLSTYIKGEPVQILTASNPQNVIIRTEANRTGFYLYSFMDAPGQQTRYWDSWSRWEWDACLGQVVGLSTHDNSILIYTMRQGKDGWSIVADVLSRDSDSDDLPILDSRRQYPMDLSNVPDSCKDKYFAAVRGNHKRQYTGVKATDAAEITSLPDVNLSDVYVGMPHSAYYEPTAPYRRDKDNVAILDGRMTLTSLLYSVKDSGAFSVDMWKDGYPDSMARVLDLTNWRISDSRVTLGAVPVRDGQHRVFIGREIREYRLRVSAKRWYPLTLTTIEWQAQVFSNRR